LTLRGAGERRHLGSTLRDAPTYRELADACRPMHPRPNLPGSGLRIARMHEMLVTWQMIVELFVLAIPIACVARTVVFEEIFREPREYCIRRSQLCRKLLQRKFFYLFTCEYCFSHYISLIFMFLAGYHLLFLDWRGYLIAFFSLVFVANLYLNLYNRMRVDITAQKVETKAKEQEIQKIEEQSGTNSEPNGKDMAGDGQNQHRIAT
jgi:hypothetical protein